MPTPAPRTWPVMVGLLSSSAFKNAKFEFVHADFFRERIVKLLLRDGALRNTEATKGAGGNKMGVNGAGERAIVRNFVRSRAVNRHARGDGGAPGGICAGVEFALEIHGEQFSVGGGTGAAMNF